MGGGGGLWSVDEQGFNQNHKQLLFYQILGLEHIVNVHIVKSSLQVERSHYHGNNYKLNCGNRYYVN